VGETDSEGFWIKSAAHVNLPVLLAASAAWWRRTSRLREGPVQLRHEMEHYGVVIDCRGIAATDDPLWRGVPWEYSKGELLEIAVDGLCPNIVFNRGHWVLPVANGRALVGETQEPGLRDPSLSGGARVALEASAREILQRDFVVRSQWAGIRVNLPDKLPVVGRHPDQSKIGLVNGLTTRGALLAPYLAQQWAKHVQSGTTFDPALDVQRFF
jgi:glycine oxidase